MICPPIPGEFIVPISLAPSAFMSNADRHDRRAKAIYAPAGGSRMINVDVNSFNKMGSVFYAALIFTSIFSIVSRS